MAYPNADFFLVLDQAFYISSNFLLCAGIFLYADKKLPKGLLTLSLLILVTNSIGIYLYVPFMVMKQLEIIFVATLLVYSGIYYCRRIIPNRAHHVVGISFVFWGMSIAVFLFVKTESSLVLAQVICSLNALIVSVALLHSHFGRMYQELNQKQEIINYNNSHDKLTNLYTRNYMEYYLENNDSNKNLPFSIIMGDMNGLKLVNDTFGHIQGDILIRDMARILTKETRKSDLVARWGGDEFVILLPNTDTKITSRVVKAIKEATEQTDSVTVPLSISLGQVTKTSEIQDLDELFRLVDALMFQDKIKEGRKARSKIIETLENLLSEKDVETREHVDRMKVLVTKLGHELKLPDFYINELSAVAALHDIGKITIPDEILKKSSNLTEDEWETIKRHPEVGYRIAQASDQFSHVSKFILHHHERWDGTGYPEGLKGKEIPFASRVISVVDAYDVMTNIRPYKKAMSTEPALLELLTCSGTQFDSEIVAVFVKMMRNNNFSITFSA